MGNELFSVSFALFVVFSAFLQESRLSLKSKMNEQEGTENQRFTKISLFTHKVNPKLLFSRCNVLSLRFLHCVAALCAPYGLPAAGYLRCASIL